MAHPIARQLFSNLNHLYNACEQADYRDEMQGAGYSEGEAEKLQGQINQVLSTLEDILPGLQAEIDDH